MRRPCRDVASRLTIGWTAAPAPKWASYRIRTLGPVALPARTR